MNWRSLACGLLLIPVLTACERDLSDLEAYVAQIKARKSTQIEPIPELAPYQPFTYLPGARREPFQPFTRDAQTQERRAVSGVSPDFHRPREALESFPLDSLRMQGTLSMAGARYALITAPDGIVHRVGVGDHMGQNFGEVVAISRVGARLIEIIPDGLSGYMRREASIALSDSGTRNP